MRLTNVRKMFRSGNSYMDIFSRQSTAFERAHLLHLLFYCYLISFFMDALDQIDYHFAGLTAIDPPFLFFWLQNLPIVPMLATTIVVGIGSIFGCIFFPHIRTFRILLAICFMIERAFHYSSGKVGHAYHGFVYVSLILCHLPAVRYEVLKANRQLRQTFLNIFWLATAFVLLHYTVSGLWKIGYGGIYQFFTYTTSLFDVKAMAYILADFATRQRNDPLLAKMMIDYTIIAVPSLAFALYFQVFSFWAVFRPELHRTWGVLLIIFHALSILLMHINFSHQCVLIALFLIFSPFAVAPKTKREWITAFPLGGWLTRWFPKKPSS